MVSSDLYGYGVAHKQSIKAQHRVDTILGFSEDSGFKSNGRWKRASRILFGAASRAGAKATEALVKGGKLIPTEKKFRVYQKNGDLLKALNDFESVTYTERISFKTIDRGHGISGTIGDRQVILLSNGDRGRPTIDVIKVVNRYDSAGKKEVFGKITDRITYEDWLH